MSYSRVNEDHWDKSTIANIVNIAISGRFYLGRERSFGKGTCDKRKAGWLSFSFPLIVL